MPTKHQRKPQSKPLRSFASLFPGRDQFTTKDGRPGWRVRSSGVNGPPEDAETTHAIISFLESTGVQVTRSGIGGMCAADLYTVQARFLDGRLYGETGNYLYQRKGVWIAGAKAALFVALGLGLNVPEQLVRELALDGVTFKDLRRELAPAA